MSVPARRESPILFIAQAAIGFALLAVSSATAHSAGVPETQVLYWGGTQSLSQSKDLFDETAIKAEAAFQRKKFKVDALYGGNGTQNRKAANQIFSNAKPLSVDRMYEMMKKTIRDIETGKINSGSQLLLWIDAHGHYYFNSPDPSTVAWHYIVPATDPEGEFTVDLLEDLKAACAKKGILLGIVDLSCYSEYTQSLADENTCVISATGLPLGYGMKNFATALAEAMSTADNLEEAFLAARKADAVGAPAISTPEQKTLDSILRPLTLKRRYPVRSAESKELALNYLKLYGVLYGDGFRLEHPVSFADSLPQCMTSKLSPFASLTEPFTKNIKAITTPESMREIEGDLLWLHFLLNAFDGEAKSLRKTQLLESESRDDSRLLPLATIGNDPTIAEWRRILQNQFSQQKKSIQTEELARLSRQIETVESRLYERVYKLQRERAQNLGTKEPCRRFRLQ